MLSIITVQQFWPGPVNSKTFKTSEYLLWLVMAPNLSEPLKKLQISNSCHFKPWLINTSALFGLANSKYNMSLACHSFAAAS
jgi:hypothetical protein